MHNIIKMDLYRMFHTKIFYINTILVTLISALTMIGMKFAMRALASSDFAANISGKDLSSDISQLYPDKVNISELLSSPFVFSLLIIPVLLSVVTFCYADISNGYIKNIAGQLPKKGQTVISKFICIAVHNGVFMLCALAGSIIGEACSRTVVIDSKFGNGLMTFFLKFLLLQSLCAIILFVTTGIRNKTFASVIAVIFSTGLLGMVYMGLDKAASYLFKIDLKTADYAPDQLIQQSHIAFANGLIVSVIICTVFVWLTYTVFNKSDVK